MTVKYIGSRKIPAKIAYTTGNHKISNELSTKRMKTYYHYQERISRVYFFPLALEFLILPCKITWNTCVSVFNV